MAASCWVETGCLYVSCVDAKGLILKDQVYNENKDMYYLGKGMAGMATNSWYQE